MSQQNPTSAATGSQTTQAAQQTGAASTPTFQISAGGVDKRKCCQEDFDDLLMKQAEINMKRRGSATLDESDINNANRHLLVGKPKAWLKEIFCLIVIVVGGIPIAHGISKFGTDQVGTGIWLIVGGLAVSGLGAFFEKYEE